MSADAAYFVRPEPFCGKCTTRLEQDGDGYICRPCDRWWPSYADTGDLPTATVDGEDLPVPAETTGPAQRCAHPLARPCACTLPAGHEGAHECDHLTNQTDGTEQ